MSYKTYQYVFIYLLYYLHNNNWLTNDLLMTLFLFFHFITTMVLLSSTVSPSAIMATWPLGQAAIFLVK